MKKVLIIYKYLPQYRVEFFQQLKDKLASHDIQLNLIYGKSNKIDALKKDEAEIDWAKQIKNRRLGTSNRVLIWQPCLKDIRDCDLVITLPENKLILNYYLMIARHFSKYKFAFWGHVYSMQKDLDTWRNKAKLLFLGKCDWWFAYTIGAKQFLIDRGYPEKQVTIVQNAIDTSALKKYYREINDDDSQILKDQLGIKGDQVALFCGAMYPDKSFDFILEACYIVKKEIPDFHMIFIGSGIEDYKIKKAASENDWIHYAGPKFGKDKVRYFKISSIQIMPRLVGLAIIDSFAMETPIITTNNPFHGPEIDYLENGINGLITNDTIKEYAQAVADILRSGKFLELIEGCKKSANIYTIENMAENFKNGILSCFGM